MCQQILLFHSPSYYVGGKWILGESTRHLIYDVQNTPPGRHPTCTHVCNSLTIPILLLRYIEYIMGCFRDLKTIEKKFTTTPDNKETAEKEQHQFLFPLLFIANSHSLSFPNNNRDIIPHSRTYNNLMIIPWASLSRSLISHYTTKSPFLRVDF